MTERPSIFGREETRIGTITYENMDEEAMRLSMQAMECLVPPPDGAQIARIETYQISEDEVEIVHVVQW